MLMLLKMEIDSLKNKIVLFSDFVSSTLFLAIQSVVTKDEDLVIRVKNNYKLIDQMEEDIEERCLKILALYRPVANDLRFVIEVLGINTSLERIATIALNISKKTKYLTRMENFKMPIDLKVVFKSIEIKLGDSIACFVQLNFNSINNISFCENEFQRVFESSKALIKKATLSDLARYEGYNSCLNIIRHLEEIGVLIIAFFNVGRMLKIEINVDKIYEKLNNRVETFKTKRIG